MVSQNIFLHQNGVGLDILKDYLKFYYVFIKVSLLHLLISLLTILWHDLQNKRLNKGFLGDRVYVIKEKTIREEVLSNQFHRH